MADTNSGAHGTTTTGSNSGPTISRRMAIIMEATHAVINMATTERSTRMQRNPSIIIRGVEAEGVVAITIGTLKEAVAFAVVVAAAVADALGLDLAAVGVIIVANTRKCSM